VRRFNRTRNTGTSFGWHLFRFYGVRNQDCRAVHDQAIYGDCSDTRYSEMPALHLA